jgi:hypothetical protein
MRNKSNALKNRQMRVNAFIPSNYLVVAGFSQCQSVHLAPVWSGSAEIFSQKSIALLWQKLFLPSLDDGSLF